MKLYTDGRGNFFKTDKFLKNLRIVEINTIRDFVYTHSLDALVLLCAKDLVVGRFDEIFIGKQLISGGDEPDLIGEVVDVDFTTPIPMLDILAECIKYQCIDFDELKASHVFIRMDKDWDDDLESWVWTIEEWHTGRVATVVIDADDVAALTYSEQKQSGSENA